MLLELLISGDYTVGMTVIHSVDLTRHSSEYSRIKTGREIEELPKQK